MPVNPTPCPVVPGSGGLAATVVELCDTGAANTPFLMHTAYTAAGVPSSFVYTEIDSVAPYVPVGPVLDECPCTAELPFTIVEHWELVSGVDSFTVGGPASGVVSISILVRDVGAPGSVTVTTVDGPMVALDNETYGWGVIREQDTELDEITIDATNAADRVLVLYSVAV
jgi:hypothetical protein